MTRTRKIALAALAVTLGAGALGATALPALAQEGMRRGGDEIFRQADADRDGRVTAEEGWAALSARFAAADADKDGGVTWEEFRNYVRAEMGRRGDRSGPPAGRGAAMEERGQGFFRALDADRDGKVTLAELRPFGEAMFRARDTNGDNALSREEVRPHRARPERREPRPAAPAQPQ